MRQLAGRVAVVTGAASGIGRSLGLALAAKGCDLALVDLDVEGLEQSAREILALGAKASIHRVDVADRDAMQRLPEEVVREHGRAHILVNNAGVSVSGLFEEQSLDDFEWLIGVNFWGVVYGCRFFLPLLKEVQEAHVVNISSLFGIVGIPTQSSYNASKFAVRGFSEALHTELAGTSVGVSVVHPGGVNTNIVRSSRLSDESERAELISSFERLGMPPDRAAAKIVRGIEANRLRIRIGRETYVLDWAKRAFPTATQKLIAAGYRRSLRQLAKKKHEQDPR
jgi:short-subunit dehydrogenase